MTDAVQVTTAPQKTAMRTGPCVAVACRERCDQFLFQFRLDNFDHCVCGHTKQAHAYAREVRA